MNYLGGLQCPVMDTQKYRPAVSEYLAAGGI